MEGVTLDLGRLVTEASMIEPSCRLRFSHGRIQTRTAARLWAAVGSVA